MSSFLKDLFKKDKNTTENSTVTELSAEKETAKTAAKNKDVNAKKGKHGQPGVCCGSCS